MVDTARPPQYPHTGLIHDTTDNGHLYKGQQEQQQHQSLNTFEGRLKTFRNWPNLEFEASKLAESGFYYTQYDDVVRCPFCGVEGYKWRADDNPMDDHLRWMQAQGRSCSFMNDRRSEHDDSQTANNQQQQPDQQQQLDQQLQQQSHSNSTEQPGSGRDTCGKYGVEILPCSVPEDSNLRLEKLGVTKVKGPAHPEHVLLQTRVESFKQWPKSLRQKPEDLASAGFYYLGVGDQTLCFHCGGGLKDWEENDEPWEQHAMWFPKCSYLLMKKGLDYVNKLKDKREAEDTTLPGTSSCSTGSNSTSGVSSNNLSSSSNSSSLNYNIVETKVSSQSGAEVSANQSSDDKEKNTSEKDQTLCKICFKNELGVVFLPCGHIVACVDCASALSTCAVCRKPLEATVRAFLS